MNTFFKVLGNFSKCHGCHGERGGDLDHLKKLVLARIRLPGCDWFLCGTNSKLAQVFKFSLLSIEVKSQYERVYTFQFNQNQTVREQKINGRFSFYIEDGKPR